ncbi:MAG: 50S ribosomal protein L12 [Candidatus Aenigmatarchaeota archaeon]
MNEVYAALLLYESKKEINEENIKKVLEAAGATIEENKIKALVTALQGVNIEEALKQATFVQTQATTTESEKKEEKKEEDTKKKEEEAVAGLASLFG